MHVKRQKQRIRTDAIKQRRQLSCFQQQQRSQQVLSQLTQLLNMLKLTSTHSTTQRSIAIYHAINNEVDLNLSLDLGLSLGLHNYQLYIPKLNPLKKGDMAFTPAPSDSEIEINAYGIVESTTLRGSVTADKLDIIIMPLVAFDDSGTRLGYGGGYYDKALSITNNTTEKAPDACPVLIGVAYDFQQYKQLPCEQHDIKLDYIVTDSEIINCSS